MKKLFFILATVAIAGACCNKTKTCNTSAEAQVKPISVDSFLTVAPTMVGKEVYVTGTVNHVCKHGGKRIQLFSSCPSKTIQANASDSVSQFDISLEGGEVCVRGTVEESRIDKAYVDEWETKLKEAEANLGSEAEMEHKAGSDHHATLEKIAGYRQQIEASANGYISFYSIKVNSYTTCKAAEAKGCCPKAYSVKACADTAKVAKSGCGGCKHEKKCGES